MTEDYCTVNELQLTGDQKYYFSIHHQILTVKRIIRYELKKSDIYGKELDCWERSGELKRGTDNMLYWSTPDLQLVRPSIRFMNEVMSRGYKLFDLPIISID